MTFLAERSAITPVPARLEPRERDVAALLRRHRSLSKAEIARATGLSNAQVGNIVKRLEAAGFLIKGAPLRRGQVGQPPAPYMLNAEAGRSIGVHVGRRKVEVALLDYLGGLIDMRVRIHQSYDFAEICGFVADSVAALQASHPSAAPLLGVGVALPRELWGMRHVFVENPNFQRLSDVDFSAALERLVGAPVWCVKSSAAVCAAQLAFEPTLGVFEQAARDFLVIFVGYYLGGGVVLDGEVRAGPNGAAGSIGAIPAVDGSGAVKPLSQIASLAMLDEQVAAAGGAVEDLWLPDRFARGDWSAIGEPLTVWIEAAAAGVAQAIIAAAAVADLSAVVIDGSFPPDIRRRFVAETRRRYRTALPDGDAAAVQVIEGGIGRNSRMLGAGVIPLFAECAPESGAH